jgi:hypothetical protein
MALAAMPPPPVLPAFFGATNARAHDPLPMWSAGQATDYTGAAQRRLYIDSGHCERSEASSAVRPRRTSSPAHRVLSPVSDSKLEMPIGLGAAEEVRKNGAAVGSAQCAIILPADANNSPCSAQKSSLLVAKKLPVNSANLTR